MGYCHVSSQLPANKIAKILDGYDAVAIRFFTEQEIKLAEHLAKKAFGNKTNIAKKFKYEFLLWLAGKRDIKSAIEETMPKGNEFLIIVFSGGKKEILKNLEVEHIQLDMKEKASYFRIEEMSLSRLK
jgi:tRNA threonylcarbamoyladenosine modification (KEOPS) complex Cgi121 subunit